MEINKVRWLTDDIFRVNDNMDVPDNMENRHRVMIQEWIDAGGVVTDWVDPITPYQHWDNEISKLDGEMPRYAEDILDGMPDKSGVAQITLDRLQGKKT